MNISTTLSLTLLELFAKGDIPGTVLHRLASAAWDDGWGRGCPLAERLAKVGTSGTQPSHFVRDIVNVANDFGILSSGAKPYKVDLAGGHTVWIYLPHEILFHMAMKVGPNWALGPDRPQLDRQLHEWATHPDVRFQGDVSTVGIAGIHGDGVTYTSSNRAGGQRSVAVVSMNIISSTDLAVRNQRHILFVVSKSKFCDCCMGFHTYQKLMDVIAWSFRCLSLGKSPALRHDGTAFTEEDVKERIPRHALVPHFALLQVRGDWEWLAQAFRFPWPSSTEFCWMCSANKQDYIDFRPTAPHRSSVISHTQYLQSCMAAGIIPSLFQTPGFLLQHVAVDSMHAADLGCFQDALGSLLWLEISNKQ